MEKFMYLFRGGGRLNQSPEEWQGQMQKWYQWIASLQADGSYVNGDPLQAGGTQVRGRDKVVTDGPFTEAKEMVGGYIVVNARDMDHAVEISKGCPIFDENGQVEIRAVQKM
jgi:hypothetical protein